ncbi:DNA primase [Pleionea litopenaei]|uniref:DNA primase n=1 Tax=Pleionea litopenaei TaxID=3070815 RepID=A0AA51RQC2_9GAMM|nr:DNA primase [Pleionea sp. HL-JVS1]WMS85592.1 DNA primase [Pleionea sp. HL-JVS1]
MAGRIPKSFIDDLINRTDIVEVIERRITLKRAGKNYQACCPFHNEKTPSFSVSPDKQFYYCFGCGATGNAVSFVMEYDGLEFVDAIEDLAHAQGLEVPREASSQQPQRQWDHDYYQLMEKTAQFYQQQLKQPKFRERVVTYLKDRGVSGEIARDYGLGYAPDEWHSLQALFGHDQSINKALVDCGMLIEKDSNRYDRFRDRLMFPIRDRRGRVIAFGGRVIDKGEPKYLNSPETEIFHKGQELYGLYEMRQFQRKSEWAVVVEGYMDVVALAQFGIRNAVATLGTATSSTHIQQLFRVCPKIVFCFDGDRAGRDAALRALNHSLPQVRDNRDIRFMFLPDGEDPDTQVRRIGAEQFTQDALKSPSIFEFLLDYLRGQVDMDTFEGPGQLANLAKPFLALIADAIHRERFIQQLAMQVGLSETKLNQLLLGADSSSGQEQSTQHHGHSQHSSPKRELGVPLTNVSQLTPIRRAITLLLHQPQLVTQLPPSDWLANLNQAGNEILRQMIEILRNDPNISVGAIIEHWRGSSIQQHLLKLANEEILTPESGQAQELSDILARLEKSYKEQRFTELQQRSQRGPLSTEEKQEYQSLLLELSH